MKVCPVDQYVTRPLPMQHEFDECALAEISASNRWQRTARIAGSCAVLQWLVGCSGDVSDSAAVVPIEATDQNLDRASTGSDAIPDVAVVVPILEEALANDGRGAFGCVAVSAPAFLSEDDALDLIRKEFSKAGLVVDERAPVVADVAKPETETWEAYKRDKDGGLLTDSDGNFIVEPLSFHARQPFPFDLSCNGQKIRIEYVGMSDYHSWEKPLSGGCSVSRFDFADTARRLRESLINQPDLEKGIYGLFFDPMTPPEEWPGYPDTTGMTEAEGKHALGLYHDEIEKAVLAAESAALQKQIDHFLSELRALGIIETPAP